MTTPEQDNSQRAYGDTQPSPSEPQINTSENPKLQSQFNKYQPAITENLNSQPATTQQTEPQPSPNSSQLAPDESRTIFGNIQVPQIPQSITSTSGQLEGSASNPPQETFNISQPSGTAPTTNYSQQSLNPAQASVDQNKEYQKLTQAQQKPWLGSDPQHDPIVNQSDTTPSRPLQPESQQSTGMPSPELYSTGKELNSQQTIVLTPINSTN
jgi:hypothetical protein